MAVIKLTLHVPDSFSSTTQSGRYTIEFDGEDEKILDDEIVFTGDINSPNILFKND